MNDPNITLGDTFTMAGFYQRRTFWQWLRGEDRKLRVFHVTKVARADNGAIAFYEYQPGQGA